MQYESPDTLEAAAKMLASANDARILAGGTDLLVQMRAEVLSPSLVIDIKKVAETRTIK